MKNLLIALLALSIIFNVVLAAVLINMALTGCAEIPNGKIGVLTRDIEVGRMDGSNLIFTLPKGLIVKDASATGAGWFEPNRFRLVVTSDQANLINYQVGSVPESGHDNEFYSADIRHRRDRNSDGGAVER